MTLWQAFLSWLILNEIVALGLLLRSKNRDDLLLNMQAFTAAILRGLR